MVFTFKQQACINIYSKTKCQRSFEKMRFAEIFNPQMSDVNKLMHAFFYKNKLYKNIEAENP